MKVSFPLLLVLLLQSPVLPVEGDDLLTYRQEYHGEIQADTTVSVSELERYPARGLILSLAIPGAGQWYAGAKKKSLIYVGMELAGIAAWYQFKKRGESLVAEYEDFADKHWSLQSWVDWAPYLYAQGPEYHDVIIDGTHHLKIILESGVIVSSDTLAPPGWTGDLSKVNVIRNSEYYENIGKYDQFVSGWDDIFDENSNPAWEVQHKDVGDTVEVIIMTENRRKYLNIRKDSNGALQLAGYAVSVIMLNHVVSAIDAFLETRRGNRASPPIGMSVRPLYGAVSSYGIRGISFSISW